MKKLMRTWLCAVVGHKSGLKWSSRTLNVRCHRCGGEYTVGGSA